MVGSTATANGIAHEGQVERALFAPAAARATVISSVACWIIAGVAVCGAGGTVVAGVDVVHSARGAVPRASRTCRNATNVEQEQHDEGQPPES